MISIRCVRLLITGSANIWITADYCVLELAKEISTSNGMTSRLPYKPLNEDGPKRRQRLRSRWHHK